MRYFVGIDLGGTNIRSGLVDESGKVLFRDSRPTEVDRGQDHSVGRIVDSARAVVAKGGLKYEDITAIGIGSPGPLDHKKGLALSPVNFPTWGTVPLSSTLSDGFNGVPTLLDNDANVVAYGENWLGAGKHTEHFICITLGTGVGGGIVSHGRLIHGSNGNAGEIGHISIDYNGRPCPCGGVGCLERYCSATAVVDRTLEAIHNGNHLSTSLTPGPDLTAETIASAAKDGDELALKIFEDTGVFLGMGICTLTALFQAEVIAIGGGMAQAGDLLFDPILRIVRKHAFPGIRETLEVTGMLLGEDAAILGAAKLAMDGGVELAEKV